MADGHIGGTPVFETIRWDGDAVVLIDQRYLPAKEDYLACKSPDAVAEAIQDMVVRGAPAIGVTAALGIALGLKQSNAQDIESLRRSMESLSTLMASTRPTAVNLFWAIDRMKKRFDELASDRIDNLDNIVRGMEAEAVAIQKEDIEINRRMGAHGADLVPDGARILTHCNAGALATAGYGTALGVMYAAKEAGKNIEVFADETRPFLQGARLTAWELAKNGVPVTLITDNMAGYFMAKGEIDMVIVGSDRIAGNGDVCNKIGTYSVAVLAKEHGIPFYAVAPTSTFDLSITSGKEIPIEERSPDEVTHVHGVRLAPEGVAIRNPAFDVTPARLVTAIVCENGVAKAPFTESLSRLAKSEQAA
jgi:methylthioribose-1-phosphate isomerase